MGDPLSVTANVIAILESTVEVIGYFSSVKDAPKECQQCETELVNLLPTLLGLRGLAQQTQHDEPWSEQLRKLNAENGPLDQYKQALELLRSRVDAGHGRQRFGKRLRWKFTKEQVAAIQQRIERLKSLVIVALTTDAATLHKAIRADTKSIRATLLPLQAGVTALQTTTQSLKDDTTSIRQTQLQAEHQKALDWLSPLDFLAIQTDIIRRRQEGTAQWFLNSTEFQEWTRGQEKTLFCPGIPGAGKTMMAAVAIDHLTRTYQDDDVGVAYIFCNYKAQAEQQFHNLVASFLRQLTRQSPSLMNVLTELFDEHARSGTKPASDELIAKMASACEGFSSVYLVIDALDECTKTNATRDRLIDLLRGLQTQHDVRLFFTARPIPEVTTHFETVRQLRVQAAEADIRRYVNGRLFTLPACVRNSPTLQVEVSTRITGAAGGMFLLARLYVDSLQDQTSAKKVRAKLADLNRGLDPLDEAYREALLRIESQLPGHCSLARRALSWITLSKRQLDVEEFRIALAVEIADQTLDTDNLGDLDEIISCCAGLVNVDVASGKVQLVHYTAQEYFDRMSFGWKSEMQEEIARVCLTYLSFDDFKSGRCDDNAGLKQRLIDFPFFDYAARFWSYHVRPVQELVSPLALRVLGDPMTLQSITQCMFTSNLNYGGSSFFPARYSILHMLARYGLCHLANQLFVGETTNCDTAINAKDSRGHAPLYYASYHGHERLVQLLLERGADVNAQGTHGDTSLLAATQGGHEQVVKLLLRQGADTNARGPFGSTLHVASLGGHSDVARILLDNGAKIDQECCFASGDGTILYGNAIQAASFWGKEQVVKILLEKGADANTGVEHYNNALFAASMHGDPEIVELLLKHGADISAEGDFVRLAGANPGPPRGNVLQAASYWGKVRVVKLLLKQGADVNAQGGDYGNALQAAACRGREQVVELLLANGANVNSHGGRHGSALQAAARGHHEQLVKLLLEHGADVNAWDGKWGPKREGVWSYPLLMFWL